MSRQIHKVVLDRADMFIEDINLEKTEIAYEIREKESGKLLEPKRIGKFEVLGQQVLFDRFFVPLTRFEHILEQT